MNYTPKGNTRDKRTRGCHNMRGQQDDAVVIVVVVWSSPTLSVRSAYDICRLVDMSLLVSLSLLEAKTV